ncbi:3-keto-disaccharide hydrolase [Niabella hirudinis]|uniref:3-keto-disaccharide hydrolase n=1 Tax=Niabella hirudinis TaxID=1285929 RepID=UPI003EBB3C6A
MKKQLYLTFATLYASGVLYAQGADPRITEVWNPEPRIVTPGQTSADPPSDAIVLFNGSGLSNWERADGKGAATWKLENNAMTVAKGAGAIRTKQSFGDCQLHVEWRTPSEVKGDGQGRGNSGIFLMSNYELQVLDSYKNRTYSNGQAGSIYKQLMPLANASRKPGEWQTYDIIFTAPRFNKDSTVKSQGRITVIHNGVLVQNNAAILGATEFIGIPQNIFHKEKEPIILQDHGNPVSFRNIWIRELE